MSAMTDTSTEAVERLAAFHSLSVDRYDAEEESGLKACAAMTATTLRALAAERDALRAEVASLRLTLGGKTFGADVPEPIGCPMPGACSQVKEIKRLRQAVERARGEALEDAAAEVDCGCDIRSAVLDRLASDGEKRASYLCTHGDVCCAIQAAAIRAGGAGHG